MPDRVIIIDEYNPMRDSVRIRLRESTWITDLYCIQFRQLHVAIKLRPELDRGQVIYVEVPDDFTFTNDWWKLVAFDAPEPKILNAELPQNREKERG